MNFSLLVAIETGSYFDAAFDQTGERFIFDKCQLGFQ